MGDKVSKWVGDVPCISYHVDMKTDPRIDVRIEDERGEWYGCMAKDGNPLRIMLVKKSEAEETKDRLQAEMIERVNAEVEPRRRRKLAIQKEVERDAAERLGMTDEARILSEQIAELMS